jgi:capsular exopolysaccharide synthesis family protein
VIGFAGGIGLAFLREQINDTIASPIDITAYLRVPFLGLIPEVPESANSALYTHEKPKSSVAEGARALRTMLELTPHGEPPKCLLVTSSLASEGKTATTVRLGIAFATVGKRVLLVDADLRRPKLHSALGVRRGPGLSDVLSGATPWHEGAVQTVVPGLLALPVGSPCDQPHELLAGPRLGTLLEDLQEHFDIVIVDTPPAAVVADAVVMSKVVEGVVMVVRAHAVSRVIVGQTLARLQQVGANVLGIVLNAVNIDHQGYGYKYYHGYKNYYYTYDPDGSSQSNPARAAKKNSA